MLNAEQAEEARDILEAAAKVVEEVNTFLGSMLLRDAVKSIRIVALGFNPDLAMGAQTPCLNLASSSPTQTHYFILFSLANSLLAQRDVTT